MFEFGLSMLEFGLSMLELVFSAFEDDFLAVCSSLWNCSISSGET
jgi:hypothetical protein